MGERTALGLLLGLTLSCATGDASAPGCENACQEGQYALSMEGGGSVCESLQHAGFIGDSAHLRYGEDGVTLLHRVGARTSGVLVVPSGLEVGGRWFCVSADSSFGDGHFVVRTAESLGDCPGSTVNGTLDVCHEGGSEHLDADCPDGRLVEGQLDGASVHVGIVGSSVSEREVLLTLENGGFLLVYVSGSEVIGGTFIPDDDGRGSRPVYCIQGGSITRQADAGPLSLGEFRMVITELTKLGVCPTDAPSEGANLCLTGGT